MSHRPSTNGANGRDRRGRFMQGNPGGPGNPHAKHVQVIRQALFDAVSADDLRAITAALIRKAKAGDVNAAREVFDRLLGKAKVGIEIEGAPVGSIDQLRAKMQALIVSSPAARQTIAGLLSRQEGGEVEA